MNAYYNEIDPYCAQWLRNLIAAGHIAPGEVDERSIVDVRGIDVRGFTQVHLCAGVGVWSYALRLAGWEDSQRVWTASFPCQPFSAAGRGGGFCDERHLWPHGARLIGECRPDTVFGEQVASADGLAWLDFVCADLEATGYAIGAVDTCAAGFGAPHIRQRLYFVADSGIRTSERDAGSVLGAQAQGGGEGQPHGNLPLRHSDGGATGELANATESGRRTRTFFERGEETYSKRTEAERSNARDEARRVCAAGDMGDSEREGSQGLIGPDDLELHRGTRADGSTPTAGFWRDARWLPCLDGKARPVEPGTFPLAHGAAARVGRLRAYGNAIVAPQAAEFVKAYMECRP